MDHVKTRAQREYRRHESPGAVSRSCLLRICAADNGKHEIFPRKSAARSGCLFAVAIPGLVWAKALTPLYRHELASNRSRRGAKRVLLPCSHPLRLRGYTRDFLFSIRKQKGGPTESVHPLKFAQSSIRVYTGIPNPTERRRTRPWSNRRRCGERPTPGNRTPRRRD